jgi:YgiT-type zinc finger domain-containing protein
MGNAHPEEARGMKCSIQGCPGKYEERQIVHTVRYKGQVIVIENVPAEVCSVCGDVLLKPETVRHIEALLRSHPQPATMVPLYEYA